MAIDTLVAFWIVSALFIITPGADWAYAITAGLHDKATAPAIGGLLSGHLAAPLIVAAGVGSLAASTPATLGALTVAGSVYLLWLGIGMLLRPPLPIAGETGNRVSWAQWAARGVGVSGLNPKVFLLFVALLPQFVDPAAHWSPPAQMLALGSIHIVTCGLVYSLVALCSHSLLRTRPEAARVVSRVSGAAMLLIALVLLAERF